MSVEFDRSEAGPLLVAAFDALSLPVLLHDHEQIIYANSAAAELLGAPTPGDLAGLTLDAFLVPELAGVVKERRAYLLRDRMVFTGLPIMMRALDGRTIRLKVDARPVVFEDRTIGLVTIAP